MAREIIIRILAEQPDSPSPDALEQGDENNAPKKSGQSKSKEKKSLSKLLTAHFANRVWGVIKSNAIQYTNKYFDVTENYKAKVAVNNAMSTIDFGMSTFVAMKASSILFEGTAIGGVGGMAVAALGIGISKGMEAFNTYATEAQGILNNAYSNYFYSTRAGFVSGGHGTEN